MTPSGEPPVYDRIGSGYTGDPPGRPPHRGGDRRGARRRPDARQRRRRGGRLRAARPPRRRRGAVTGDDRAAPDRRGPVRPGGRRALPFRDRTFDASLAILTIHHWTDQAAGLAELRRVARRRVVVLTWDPGARGDFWLTAEYFPEILDLDLPRFSPMRRARTEPGAIRAIPVPVPHDCQDGFLGAFWRRPAALPRPRRPRRHFRVLAAGSRARPARSGAPGRRPQVRTVGGTSRRPAGAREPRSRLPTRRRRARLAGAFGERDDLARRACLRAPSIRVAPVLPTAVRSARSTRGLNRRQAPSRVPGS